MAHLGELLSLTEAQVLARFNLYQAYIATPTHANLPVGARGLSCQVYQGATNQQKTNQPDEVGRIHIRHLARSRVK